MSSTSLKTGHRPVATEVSISAQCRVTTDWFCNQTPRFSQHICTKTGKVRQHRAHDVAEQNRRDFSPRVETNAPRAPDAGRASRVTDVRIASEDGRKRQRPGSSP